MSNVTITDLANTLAELQATVAAMSAQIQLLERGNSASGGAVAAPRQATPAAPVEALPAGIGEEELLAISAAIGAYLGVRAHVRQIRLVSTTAWAQQGRVSIQASHRLQG
jgi:methylmalonyl-CoA carboxyltransferase 12S subunit